MQDTSILQDEKMKKVLEVILPGLASKMGGAAAGGPAPPSAKRARPEATPPKPKEKTPPPKELSPAEKLKAEGTVLYKKKDFPAAMAKYQEAASLEPENPVYVLNQTAVLFMQEKYDDCERRCMDVIELARKSHSEVKWISKAYNRLASIQ